MLAARAPVYAQGMQIPEPSAFLAPHPDWLVPDWPAPPSVRALCTTRAGGVSQPPFDSMNLGAYVGDAPQALASNLQRLCQPLQIAGKGAGCATCDVQAGTRHALASP